MKEKYVKPTVANLNFIKDEAILVVSPPPPVIIAGWLAKKLMGDDLNFAFKVESLQKRKI